MGVSNVIDADVVVVPDAGKGIYKAMAAILAEVQAIPKAGRGPATAGGYAFRGIDDVMEALHPLFAKHGIFVCPEVLDASSESYESKGGSHMQLCSLRVAWHFWASDGSTVTAVTYGQGSDSSDKAAYKAMAGAFKYVLTQTFVIPTDEAKDPERDDHEAPPPRPAGMRNERMKAQALRETRGPGEPPGLDVELKFGKFKGETWRSIMNAAMANPDGGHASWLQYMSETDISKSKPQFAEADKRQLAMIRWMLAHIEANAGERHDPVLAHEAPEVDAEF